MIEVVEVAPPARGLAWNEGSCVHCTACVGQCPSGALTVDLGTRLVAFDPLRCTDCTLCLPACGYGALELSAHGAGRTGGNG
jgi:ferredoxin